MRSRRRLTSAGPVDRLRSLSSRARRLLLPGQRESSSACRCGPMTLTTVNAEQMGGGECHVRAFGEEYVIADLGVVEPIVCHGGLGVPEQDQGEIGGVLPFVPFRPI